jgi:cytochrome c-type biogenesis protein CcmF
MLHTTIGNIGHFCVVVSFVTALVSAIAYTLSTQKDELQANIWRKYARIAFFIHGAAVLGVVTSLFYIIYNHFFEYHYAWKYSSYSLPVHFILSTFWNGQEGGFLLWIFWQFVLGIFLIRINKNWESPVMALVMATQAFLCSMVLGVVFFDTVKIGSSPFVLLREAMPELPIFKMKPDFVPEDGQGLNPLLQNYWMIIHPPTLFLGFASTIVPFAFCIAGLWQKKYTEWVKAAMPWALFSVCILGIGIMMGAYWAYETLNFGDYWNWDPVENASYVPWLVMVAAIHTMIIYRKNKGALKTTIILTISAFILILYASFLIRSGILSDVSVHSFTDLGLRGQLLILLGFFTILSIFFCIRHWKDIPTSSQEASIYTKEFWIFMGVTVLCLSAFQVLVFTSIPAVKVLIETFGGVSSLAPPADAVGFNARFQLIFALFIGLFSAIGQYVFWNRLEKQNLWQTFSLPVILSLVTTLAVVALAKMKLQEWNYMLLLFTSLFSLFGNGIVLVKLLRSNYKIAGGAVAHLGVALMLIGILFASGYSKAVSLNNSGMLLFKEDDANNTRNKENTLLWINQPTKMDRFWITYRGKRMELRKTPGFYKRDVFLPTKTDYKFLAKSDIIWNGKTYFKTGDTVEAYPENYYYEIECRESDGSIFRMYPRVQINPQMGNAASPDIYKEWGRDVYAHITDAPNPTTERQWSKTQTEHIALKDTFYINDYVAQLRDVVRTEVPGVQLSKSDAAVKADIRVMTKDGEFKLQPVFIIKDGKVGMPLEISEELGVRIAFAGIDPKTGIFTFNINTTQRDFIILKATEKPWINLLWMGVLVIVAGFVLAIFRRANDLTAKKSEKELVPAE